MLNVAGGAAEEAKAAMALIGLNIDAHKPTPLSDINLHEFEYVAALSKKIRRELEEKYDVDEAKILNIFVDDPFGDDIGQYVKCGNAIAKQLAKINFPQNSN